MKREDNSDIEEIERDQLAGLVYGCFTVFAIGGVVSVALTVLYLLGLW